ncbi:MAG: sulfotransferase [Verrucomicrobiota bacterium]
MKTKLLLLVTTQRSGSTLLFDVLRSNQSITVSHSWKNFRLLGADNARRRYPKDLTKENGFESDHLEVNPNQYGYMENILLKEKCNPIYELEKIHPHFINFSKASILNLLTTEVNLTVVVMTRKPSSSIQSFINYQERAHWYWGMSFSEIVKHFLRELSFLKHLEKIDGLKIYKTNYENYLNNFFEENLKIAQFLRVRWENSHLSDLEKRLLRDHSTRGKFRTSTEQLKNILKVNPYLKFKIRMLDAYYKYFF